MQQSIGASILVTLIYFIQLEVEYLFRENRREFAAEEKSGSTRPQDYDFIIVGGGTAGCLLAGRLSEHFKVLLLEAGGPAPSLTQVPGLRLSFQNVSNINYFYKSVEQKHLAGKVLEFTTGKMLGGSGAHNTLIFNRGNSLDFDNWAKLTNSKEWKYKNLLKVFKKLEKYNGPYPSDQRGERGPIPVETPIYPISSTFEMAAKELGFFYGDPNGPQKEGLCPIDFSQTKSRAVTTCSIFVEPYMGIRKSLTVLTYSMVTKIIFRDNIASGVLYKRHGKEFRAMATKEVIISAGTFGSPLLLFKSGIGPEEMLSKAKIKNLANLPVGENLVDNPSTYFATYFNNKEDLVSIQDNLTTEKIEQYLKGEDDGILSHPVGGIQGFFVSSIAKAAKQNHWPDIQIAGGAELPSEMSDGLAIVLFGAVAARPKSKGSIRLNIAKYLKGEQENSQLAVIDFNLLGSEDDAKVVVEGLKITLRILNTEAFKRHQITVVPFPMCAIFQQGTDPYLECVVQQTAANYLHPVGTCRMGYGPQDKNSVVDTNFKVLGMERFRIVDASVFPETPDANPNAVTMLIAQKAVDKILKQYRTHQTIK